MLARRSGCIGGEGSGLAATGEEADFLGKGDDDEDDDDDDDDDGSKSLFWGEAEARILNSGSWSSRIPIDRRFGLLSSLGRFLDVS